MIKRIKSFWRRSVKTLRVGMLAVISIAIILGTGVYLTGKTLFNNWLTNSYNSQEEKTERYESYINDLQDYITKNEVSSTDTKDITRWMNNNRNVYLFLYKDGQLFFDGSMEDAPFEDGGADTEAPDSGEEDTDGDGSRGDSSAGDDNGSDTEAPDSEGEGSSDSDPDSSQGENDGGNESESGSDNGSDDASGDGDTDGENDANHNTGEGKDEETDSENGNGSAQKPPVGGITITYPSREEIIASAEQNGLLPVEFSDGTLFVSLVDFTDYLYRDVSNIVSLIAGFVTLALILMIYFHSITIKISRLAQDVSAVYEVDNSHEIRTEEGNHELAVLTKNVEHMRSTMVSSLEKEKMALDANAELITSMSHDIRTPLTVLLGYLDVMKTVNEDERLNEYISASETTALKLKEISDDMFRYFLVFSGNDMAAEIISYEAKTLLDQLLSEHVLLLREKGYEVNIQQGSGVADGIAVMTDAPKLMRVIDNLFSNIYKYADREKRITVSTAIARGRLNLIIKNHVSEDASRAESTGVGLKTCKKICESIGARFGTEITGSRGSKVFSAHLELPIDKKEGEGNEA